MKDKDLINFTDTKSLMKFLQEPTVKIAEALTGILASDFKDWKLSAGKIVQAVIKGSLLTQLGREIEKYQEEGKIKEDYLESDIDRASFKELLEFIDEEVPDEIRFKAIKSIFFSLIVKDITEDEELLSYQLMQICKQLSSAEILVLKAVWDMVNGKMSGFTPSAVTGADMWLSNVAKYLGHNIPNLIEVHENNLMKLNLISGRTYNDRSGIRAGNDFRLTALWEKNV